MNRLLDGEFSPTTDEIAFFEQRPEVIRDWLVARAEDEDNLAGVHRVEGDLRALLPLLAPLLYTPSRFLIVPTRSAWNAHFNNTFTGTDTSFTGAVAERTQCRSVRMVCVPNTIQGEKGRLGATMFELYGPEKTHWLNEIRTVSAVNEGERWIFETSGKPQPFERPGAYKARRVRDRFPQELLAEYLLALGIDAFNEDFYLPDRWAYVVEEKGIPGDREFTFEEAQNM